MSGNAMAGKCAQCGIVYDNMHTGAECVAELVRQRDGLRGLAREGWQAAQSLAVLWTEDGARGIDARAEVVLEGELAE